MDPSNLSSFGAKCSEAEKSEAFLPPRIVSPGIQYPSANGFPHQDGYSAPTSSQLNSIIELILLQVSPVKPVFAKRTRLLLWKKMKLCIEIQIKKFSLRSIRRNKRKCKEIYDDSKSHRERLDIQKKTIMMEDKQEDQHYPICMSRCIKIFQASKYIDNGISLPDACIMKASEEATRTKNQIIVHPMRGMNNSLEKDITNQNYSHDPLPRSISQTESGTTEKASYLTNPQLTHVQPLHGLRRNQLLHHIYNLRKEARIRRLQKLSTILQKLIDHPKNQGVFNSPVDPVAQNLPDYRKVVKQPMDLGTVKRRFDAASYDSVDRFAYDVYLVFENAMTYNPESHSVYANAKFLCKMFDKNFKQVREKMVNEIKLQRTHTCNICVGNQCPLCFQRCLEFNALQYTCSGNCGQNIRRGATYYATRDGTRVWCLRCYNKGGKGPKIETQYSSHIYQRSAYLKEPKLSEIKDELYKRKLEVDVEPWVRCDRCRRWMHQVCGMFNALRDAALQDKEFVCPLCIVAQKREIIHVDLSKKHFYDGVRVRTANDLPKCALSDHLEQFIFDNLCEVGETEVTKSLRIRVVSDELKVQEIPQSIRNLFQRARKDKSRNLITPAGYPDKIPYRSKAICIFQSHDGLDVCLFAMYVQEYSSSCEVEANRGKVYISYLDSVRYMKPANVRTMVYQHTLIGYLDFVRRNGFHQAHIWSCPPMRSVSYIFWCHPPFQKTPTVDLLRSWYKKMIDLAQRKGIVSSSTTFFERYFAAVEKNKKNNSKLGVAIRRLGIDSDDGGWPGDELPPSFDGDFWPAELTRVIERKLKHRMSKRVTSSFVEDISGSSLSLRQAEKLHRVEDIKLGEVYNSAMNGVKNVKEDLLVLSLIPLAKCMSGIGDENFRNNKHETPASTNSQFVTTRFVFHQLCAYSGYQFDTLRRAKHSTMMLLHHLFNPHLSLLHNFCNNCGLLVDSQQLYHCDECRDHYSLCDWCRKSAYHPHRLHFGSICS